VLCLHLHSGLLTLDQLKRYPSESRIHFIECPANGSTDWRGPQFNNLQFMKGMMSSAEWTGVKLSVLLEDLGIKPEAKWMLAEGSDNSEMGRTIPMEKVMDDAMLVWGQNGEALRPDQGYPIRLLVPGWEGNLNVKWVKRLEFGAHPWHAKEETAKYTMLQASGKAIRFFWPMEVNSIIISPCPEKPWTDLKKGDMVFFDTHERGHVNHSGVYLGDGRFIHASSGKAMSVTISELDKGFYVDKFRWGIRKLP
jgi:sulfane dehydrogenase subunit SoxC